MKEYDKLYDYLKSQIIGNNYAAGQKLPPERQLCEKFDISRITARHALRLLENDGLVERFQGKGTFVKSTKPSKLTITESGFAKSVQKYAPGMTRRLISKKFVPAPSEISETLGLDSQVCLTAIRADILDNQTIAFDKAYIIPEYCEQLTNEFLASIDFFEKWIELEQIKISYYNETIEAIEADKEEADILNVKSSVVILKAVETYYDENNKAFAVFESYYQGNKVKLNSTISYKERSNARVSNL